jgi:hypothetical protein
MFTSPLLLPAPVTPEQFPWPPLAERVTEAVDRLLAGARGR